MGARLNNEAGHYSGAAYLILGSATPSDRDLGAADAEYTGEDKDNYAGVSVASAGDTDGDGLADVLVGASGYYGSGAAYLILGDGSPLSRSLSAADAKYTSAPDASGTGTSVATAGDFNGDGFADMLVGASEYSAGASPDNWGVGAAYLILGGPSAPDTVLDASAAQYTGEAAYDQAGTCVASAGDVDGDGFDDLLVGAPGSDAAGTWAGVAYMIQGAAAPASRSLSEADAKYYGESDADFAGMSLAGAGDVNGDGPSDVLIGASGNDEAGSYAGATYLILGSAF